MNDSTPEAGDPGWRDADRSRGLDQMVAALDHFDTWKPLQATRRALYRTLRPRPGARILDAGCGTGIDAATLAAMVQPGGAVHGMDLSEHMVSLARERYGQAPGVSFSAGDVSKIPLPDAEFDASFAMRTLQYLDDPLPAIREMARVTKPGGGVVVVEGGMSVVDLPRPELASRILGEQWMMRPHSFASELYGLMKHAGLVRVRVLPVMTVEKQPDSYFIDHMRQSAKAPASSDVTAAEAEAWLSELEARVAAGEWFSADCFFIAVGTVKM